MPPIVDVVNLSTLNKGNKMINELTPEQTAQLSVYRDKWLEIGVSTNDIDVERTLELLEGIYKQADLDMPTKHEIYDSPFEAITEMKLRYDMDVNMNDFIYGPQNADWLSFYDFFINEVNVKINKDINLFIEISKTCGWLLLFDELKVLIHNPIHIKFDENNLTHCEDDLAIKYRDGTGVAVWHGTFIPQEWILDKSSITPKIMFSHENIERRRCACEIVGWSTVLDNLESVVVDKDVDDTVGTLLEVNLPDSGKERFLLVRDPNVDKRVGIPVPYEMETALEANSWTYGIDKFEFKPEFRV